MNCHQIGNHFTLKKNQSLNDQIVEKDMIETFQNILNKKKSDSEHF